MKRQNKGEREYSKDKIKTKAQTHSFDEKDYDNQCIFRFIISDSLLVV